MARPTVGQETFDQFAACAQTVLDAVSQVEQKDKFSPRVFDVVREKAEKVRTSATEMRGGRYV